MIGEGGLAHLVVGIGWRQAMLTVAIVGFLMTVLSFFIIHDHPEHYQPLTPGVSLKEALKNTGKSFAKILSIKQVWLNGIYGGLIFGLFPAFAALWAVPYLMNRFQITVDLSALVASTFFFGACFGTLTLGWMSVHITKRRPIMLIGSAVSFLLLLVTLYGPAISLTMMFILFFLMGFFCSSYALCFALVGSYVTPQAKGVAMGFTNMLCIAFGAPIYQPLIGALMKWSSNGGGITMLKKYNVEDYEVGLTILPISLLLSFVLAFFIKEPNSHKSAASH